MRFIQQFLFAAFATLGFTLYYKVPKKSIFTTCIISGFMWLIYEYSLLKYNNYMGSGFIVSFLIGITSEFCAYFYKKPVTVFSLPCLIPIVPGAGMYYIMYYFIENNYELMVRNLTSTLFTAAGLSMGIVFSQALAKITKSVFRTKKSYKIKKV